MSNYPEVDRFVEQLRKAMDDTCRGKEQKPKDRGNWLWILWLVMTFASIAQAIVYWIVR